MFDLILSNPPYMPTSDIAALEPEVREHDPKMALDGGDDGLHIYRSLIPEALLLLNVGGWLLLEVGIGQSSDVSALFSQAGGYSETFTAHDPGGIARVIGGRKL